jgi:xanthosine utilization system XapX-like protein
MMKQLEGRNLAHPGCLVGIMTGLIVGIVLAGVLAASFNVPFATVGLIWLGLTVGLGLIGWIIGAFLTTKRQLAEQRAQMIVPEAQGTITEEEKSTD